MWIVTTSGFVSLVQDRKDPNKLQVRARIADDIRETFPNAEIFEKDGADYRHRAVIDRSEAAELIAKQVMDINYTSHFKDVAIARSKTDKNSRRTAYYGIWTALSRLQAVAPYTRLNSPYPRISGGVNSGYYGNYSHRGSTLYDDDAWYEDSYFNNVVLGRGSGNRDDELEPDDECYYTQEELKAVEFYYDVNPETLSDEKLEEYVVELEGMNLIPLSGEDDSYVLDSDGNVVHASDVNQDEDEEDDAIYRIRKHGNKDKDKDTDRNVWWKPWKR